MLDARANAMQMEIFWCVRCRLGCMDGNKLSEWNNVIVCRYTPCCTGMEQCKKLWWKRNINSRREKKWNYILENSVERRKKNNNMRKHTQAGNVKQCVQLSKLQIKCRQTYYNNGSSSRGGGGREETATNTCAQVQYIYLFVFFSPYFFVWKMYVHEKVN